MNVREALTLLWSELDNIEKNGLILTKEQQAAIIQRAEELFLQYKIDNESDFKTSSSFIGLMSKIFLEGKNGFPVDQKAYSKFVDNYSLEARTSYNPSVALEEISALFGKFLPSVDLSFTAFLQSLDCIPILFDEGVNFGNQNAGVNLMWLLRGWGFKGRFRFIYSDRISGKLALLLGISVDEVKGVHKELNIEFMTYAEYFAALNANKIAKTAFAVSGALDASLPIYLFLNADILWSSIEMQKNFADLLRADVFLQLSPYSPGHPRAKSNYIQKAGISTPIYLSGSEALVLETPTTSHFIDIKKFLDTKKGKKFVDANPAIQILVEWIDSEKINLMSLYGTPLKYNFPGVITKIIAGLECAKKQDLDLMNKPNILAVYYTLDDLSIPADDKGYVVITLSDSQAIEKLTKLMPGQIAILIMGHLPKPLFDGLFTYTAPNILPPVYAGANTFSNLLPRGVPALPIGAERSVLDIPEEPTDESVKDYLNRLHLLMQGEESAEQPIEQIALIVGDFILKARDANSAISKHFQWLREYVLDPSGGRIRRGLIFSKIIAELSSKEIKSALGTTKELALIKSPGDKKVYRRKEISDQELQPLNCLAANGEPPSSENVCANTEYQKNTHVLPPSAAKKMSSPSNFRGMWDPNIEKHPYTGEPIFFYRAYDDDGRELGMLKFYKHPLLCRSEAGDRHNVMEATGIFSGVIIDATALEDVCAALPSTVFEQAIADAKHSMSHGAICGIANVMGDALRTYQVSESAVQITKQLIRGGGYFSLRYCQYIEAGREWQGAYSAAYQAAVDTGSMLIANAVFDWLGRATQHIAQYADKKGWVNTSRLLRFFGRHSQCAVYAYDVSQRGLVNTAASMVAGSATQQMVEAIGRTVCHPLSKLTR